MKPITRPRISSGNRSVAIAITTEPITPPKNPGDDSRHQQQGIGGGQRAKQRAQHEAGIEEKQQALAVEAVGETRRRQAGSRGAEGIGRDRQAELLRRDMQRRHHHRAQGRDDHEVQDDGELQEGQDGDDEFLVAGKDQTRFGRLFRNRFVHELRGPSRTHLSGMTGEVGQIAPAGRCGNGSSLAQCHKGRRIPG